MPGLARLTAGMPAGWFWERAGISCEREGSGVITRHMVMQVTCARISGHRPPPKGRRTIPSTTAQQRREARSRSFTLSGLAGETNLSQPGGRNHHSGWRSRPFQGEDRTTLLYPMSLPAKGSVSGSVRPDQAWWCWLARTVGGQLADRQPGHGQLLQTLSRGQRKQFQALKSFDGSRQAQRRSSALAIKGDRTWR